MGRQWHLDRPHRGLSRGAVASTPRESLPRGGVGLRYRDTIETLPSCGPDVAHIDPQGPRRPAEENPTGITLRWRRRLESHRAVRRRGPASLTGSTVGSHFGGGVADSRGVALKTRSASRFVGGDRKRRPTRLASGAVTRRMLPATRQWRRRPRSPSPAADPHIKDGPVMGSYGNHSTPSARMRNHRSRTVPR